MKQKNKLLEEVSDELHLIMKDMTNISIEKRNPAHKRNKMKPLNKNDLKRLGFNKRQNK